VTATTDATCIHCGRKGHYASRCFATRHANGSPLVPLNTRKARKTSDRRDSQPSTDEEYELTSDDEENSVTKSRSGLAASQLNGSGDDGESQTSRPGDTTLPW
jgi:hypothetical protein